MILRKGGYVYILSNAWNRVLYTGVTSDLRKRIAEHKNKNFPRSFSSKYNCDKLVYYYFYPSITEAIAEEKRIKAGNRIQKLKLINTMNPDWKDLWEEVRHW